MRTYKYFYFRGMLRNIRIFIIISVWALTGSSLNAHPFHVSVSELRYNPQTEALEVAVKLFTDDLEEALTSSYGNQGWAFATKEQLPAADQYVRKYIKPRFTVKQNNEILPLKWVGAEYNMDAVWCYFEIQHFNREKPFNWKNILFFELFNDQKNIGHFHYNDEITSFYTTANKSTVKSEIK